jgi:hypothetical protein
LFSVVSCSDAEILNKNEPSSVSILTDIDSYNSDNEPSIKGITLTPSFKGNTDKDIQYHWSIDSDTEMFDTPNGLEKEIVNSGEGVLFVVVAEIGYVEPDTLSKSINITLTVEEIDSNNVLAKTELIVEDYSSTYKVKKDIDYIKRIK